jgi:hypothetical protein
MGRRVLLLIVAIVVGMAIGSMAQAGVPDPAESIVPNVLVSPQATMQYTVYVAETGNLPIDSALVEIVFSTEGDSLTCWCLGEAHPLIQAYSDINGEANFYIAGGGCINPDSVLAPPPVQVFANGILLDEVGVVSPDMVDDGGLLPTQGWAPGLSCAVGVSDAVKFTAPITTGTWEFCSDIDSNGAVDVTDAVLITAPITLGHFCTRD